jgi:hypothetical protein
MIKIMMEWIKKMTIQLKNKDHARVKVYIGKKECNIHNFMLQAEKMDNFKPNELIFIQF